MIAMLKGGEIMFWGRGWRNWYRMTGLPGWMRASMGFPAWGRCWYPCAPFWWDYTRPWITPQEEIDVLKQEEEILKEELKAIQERINTLEKEIKK